MKKLLIIVLFFAPVLASAATISPAAKDVSVVKGQSVTVEYALQPESGEKLYTIKLLVDFPADVLLLSSFTFAGNWIPLPQPGYDTIDNTKGIFTKTAGYPRGITGATNIGTATFTAKTTGTAHIEVDPDTIVYNSKNKNAFGTSLPAQLFDIRLIPDTSSVSRVVDLVARVTFDSFGHVPTPVALTFSIIDSTGKTVWTGTGSTTIQTSGVYVQHFFDAPTLAPGSYTLKLHTKYNSSIEDDFTQQFTIAPQTNPSYWIFWLIGGLVLLILLLFFIKRRREKDNEDDAKRGLQTPWG